MKRRCIAYTLLCLLVMCGNACAFWVWTPGTNKIINPKYAVKDTPREQYDWAMSLFQEGDYKRSAEEFTALVDNYGDSTYAPDAQFYLAKSYEKAGKYYLAFQHYENVLKLYPFSNRIEEVIEGEYRLGELFYNRSRARLMGMELMNDVEKGIEIFRTIIKNMPYSEYSDNAQYMIGLSYKKIQQYNDAVQGFQELIEKYPDSNLAEKAKYEIAQCMYLASHDADYDQETTEEAIDEFRKYTEETGDAALREEAEDVVKELREKKAENIFGVAQFYHRQKKYRSANIYYREILAKYGDTAYFSQALQSMEMIKPYLDIKK